MAEAWTTAMILDEIRTMALEDGGTPVVRRDDLHRNRVRKAAARMFGSWADAVELAGFTPRGQFPPPGPRGLRYAAYGRRDEMGRLVRRDAA